MVLRELISRSRIQEDLAVMIEGACRLVYVVLHFIHRLLLQVQTANITSRQVLFSSRVSTVHFYL